MSDETAFLAAIKAAPDDRALRLVYADWLDEHDRPGGEFLRIECELVGADPTDDLRWLLIAKLQTAGRDLDEQWIAAVSRVPLEVINARVREIQSWLQRRVTAAEILSRMAEWDQEPAPSPGLWGRLRRLFRRSAPEAEPRPDGPHVRAMREWIEANMRPGDELWEYDTAGESWAQMCGEMGYALVRGGKVIEFHMLLMN